MMAQNGRPLPVPQPESDEYWEKARVHELWLRHCSDCGETYFYPRDICPRCFSRNTTWIPSAGRAILHAFTIVHVAPDSAFQHLAPYVAAIVELSEGPRMPTMIIDVEPDPEHVRIGMSLEVAFDDVTEHMTLPIFRPATSS